jgi:hypothetical protein
MSRVGGSKNLSHGRVVKAPRQHWVERVALHEKPTAPCVILSALCVILSALCVILSALCVILSALCVILSALVRDPMARCMIHGPATRHATTA